MKQKSIKITKKELEEFSILHDQQKEIMQLDLKLRNAINEVWKKLAQKYDLNIIENGYTVNLVTREIISIGTVPKR